MGTVRQVARKFAWPAGAALLGAGLGLLYWWQVGCVTGTCPLTSSPWLTSGFGGAMGLSLAWPRS